MIFKPINNREILTHIKAFFRSKHWKNTLVFLGFVALAFVFWTFQYIRQKFDFEVPVEIRYVHVPAGIVFSDNPPREITLYVQDKGGAYLNYLINRKKESLYITVDLSGVSPARTSYVVDQAVLRNLIDDKLYATTYLKSVTPDKIEIVYSPLAQKELPVTVSGTVSPAPGYLFSDSIRIEPAKVIAYGKKSVLDTFQDIKTLPLNDSHIDKNWSVSAGLSAPEGISLSVDRVKLTATVEEYTEKTFELPVICHNVPANRRVRFFPSVVELSVKVGLSKYPLLSTSDFEISVNYNDLKAKTTANCSLILTQKPPEVNSYRIVPDVIEFLIERKSDL